MNENDLSGMCPWCVVGLAVLTALTIAKASQAYQNNPSGSNMFWLGVSMTPGGLFAKGGATAGKSMGTSIRAKLRNGNNYLRIGRITKDSPFRVSVGAAGKNYDRLGRVGKALNPLHMHLERRKAGIEFNWLKNSKGNPRSIKLWGDWRK